MYGGSSDWSRRCTARNVLVPIAVLAIVFGTFSATPWAFSAEKRPADPLFCIGTPDGHCAEFGLARQGYAAFPRQFAQPVAFTTGRSGPRDWPYIHPAPKDTWAGGKVHEFTIRHHHPCRESGKAYLVLGLVGAHAREHSDVVVAVNGKELPAQTAPGGAMEPCFNPRLRGKPDSIIFELPAGSIRSGENVITIRLEKQSWILYDYVALRRTDAPLPLTEPEPVNLLAEFSKGAMQDVDEVVFAVRKPGPDGHWYANFGYYADSDERLTYRPGGRLCRLDLRSGEMSVLLDDPEGGVRDPVVHYDARKILFSYRPGDSRYFHLYEIGIDGRGLRQLTGGPYNDIEPTYLPDGGIVFVSSRCNRWVNCWLTKVAVLHRCDGDGSNIRAISGNIEHDNTPWVLPDGRVLYQRWEYIDRSQVDYHHLWTTNPDGTGQMVYYGNQHPGTLMIDAKPIPGTEKVVSIFSPGHGRREHDGAVTVVDPKRGPDDRGSATQISAGQNFRDPWAFGPGAMMAARGTELVLLDDAGETQTMYRLPQSDVDEGFQCHEPRPLMRRERERVIPSRVNLGEEVGYLTLSDIYKGRNMEGVERGEIKKLLVLESLPKPINFTGGMDPLTYGGSFTLERVVGTVPVEEDGSAYMELPALRSLFFVALDEDDMAVKRMQSFLTVQPGEVTGCVGCHESRTSTFLPEGDLTAMQRRPSQVEPIDDCPDVFDFPRDIQPILDRLCVDCHGYEKTERGGPYAGNLILTGDRGPMFSHAYFTMTVKKLFTDSRNRPKSSYPPRSLGSSASRILEILDESHNGVEATPHERKMLRLWIEVGAPYPGTYAALGNGAIGGYLENRQINTDHTWPTTQAGAKVIQNQCATCHTGNDKLPQSLSDELGISFWRFDVDDPRLRMSRHIVFNLSRPEKSLLVLAPLAKEAGGFSICRDKYGYEADVFRSTSDEGYRTLLAMVEAGKENLEEIRRFDMPGFQPPPQYVREMVRYGVLAEDLPPDVPIDPYATDRKYWQSLWYRPEETSAAQRRNTP